MQFLTSQQRLLFEGGASLATRMDIKATLDAPVALEIAKALSTAFLAFPAARCRLQPIKYQKYPGLEFHAQGCQTVVVAPLNSTEIEISFCVLVWDVFSVLKVLEACTSKTAVQHQYVQDSLYEAEQSVVALAASPPEGLAIASPKNSAEQGSYTHHYSMRLEDLPALSDGLEYAAFSAGRILKNVDVCAGQNDVVGNLALTVIKGNDVHDIGEALASQSLVSHDIDAASGCIALTLLPSVHGVSHLTVTAATPFTAVDAYAYPSEASLQVTINFTKARFSEGEAIRAARFISQVCVGTKRDMPLVNTPVARPSVRRIAEIIHASLQDAPSSIAIKTRSSNITRQQVLAAVQRIRSLMPMGTAPIGIVADCSAEYAATALACLYAGRAFIPLDVSAGRQRLKDIIAHSAMTAAFYLLSNVSMRDIMPDSFWIDLPHDPFDSPLSEFSSPDSGNEIYRMFTSGSTGVPKQVCINEENLLALFTSYEAMFPGVYRHAWAFTSSIGFDASIKQFLGPLMYGGTVVVPDKRLHEGGAQTVEQLKQLGANVMNMTPSLLEVFVRSDVEFNHCEYMFVGGESCSKSLVRDFFRLTDRTRLINLYGPTECTINATAHEFSRSHELRISPIGKAIPAAMVTLITQTGAQANYCEEGSLVIGGPLVSEKFSRAPVELFGDALWYDTNDHCRIWFDDCIYFLGRQDSQIKVNGIRIDLIELAHILKRELDVDDIQVASIEGRPLVFILAAGLDVAERDRIKLALENNIFFHLKLKPIFVDEWKWTASGKLDFKQLQASAINTDKPSSGPHMAANTITEIKLYDLINSVLALRGEALGDLDDKLSAQGFDSLLYMELIVSIRHAFRVSLSPADVAGDSSARTIARLIEGACQAPSLIRWVGKKSSTALLVLIPPVVGQGLIFDKALSAVVSLYTVAIVDYPSPADHLTPASIAEMISEALASHGLADFEQVTVLGYSMGASIGFELVKLLEATSIAVKALHILDKAPGNRMSVEEQLIQNRQMLKSSFAGRVISDTLSKALSDDIKAYTELGFNYKVSGRINAPILLTLCTHAVNPIQGNEWDDYTASRVYVEEFDCRHEDILANSSGYTLLGGV